jgi:hypothetical protein
MTILQSFTIGLAVLIVGSLLNLAVHGAFLMGSALALVLGLTTLVASRKLDWSRELSGFGLVTALWLLAIVFVGVGPAVHHGGGGWRAHMTVVDGGAAFNGVIPHQPPSPNYFRRTCSRAVWCHRLHSI